MVQLEFPFKGLEIGVERRLQIVEICIQVSLETIVGVLDTLRKTLDALLLVIE